MKTVWSVLATWLVASLAWTAMPSTAAEAPTCAEVRMADPGWTDITATNALAGVVLEALGYRQTVRNLSVPITLLGLGKNQVDVFLGNWMPAQRASVEPLLQAGRVDLLQANLQHAKFTLAVPRYVADAGVKTVADLAAHASAFDSVIYGIEPGAPANQSIARMLAAGDFGLRGWRLVESSETSMLAQVQRRVASKRWIVFLAWEPHVMNTRYDLVYLHGGDAYFGADDGSATANTVTRHGYAAECPNAARLFRQMVFSVPLETALITDIADNKVAARAAALAQLKRQPQWLETWLAGVKTLSGEDGLAAAKKLIGG